MPQEISSTTSNPSAKGGDRFSKLGLWFVLLTAVHLLALLAVRSPVASISPLSWLTLEKQRSPHSPADPQFPFPGSHPVNPSTPLSGQFSARLLAVEAPPLAERRDAPKNWATVNSRHQTFATETSVCPLASAGPWYFGKPVKLRVTIDDTGSVLGNYTTVVDSSGADKAYQELARCLANNWEFQPASEAGKSLYSNAYITMRIDRF